MSAYSHSLTDNTIIMSSPAAAAAEKVSKFYTPKSLYFEKERRKTFIDWPIPHIISPDDLAANGFYYLRQKDYVCCIFCDGMLYDWKKGNIVKLEHENHFPHCSVLKPVGNVPLGNIPLSCSKILDKLPIKGEENPMDLPRDLYLYIRPISFDSVPQKQLDDLNTNRHNICDSNSLDSRIQSFTNKLFQQWPENAVGISAEKMARAGFLYIGKKNFFVC